MVADKVKAEAGEVDVAIIEFFPSIGNDYVFKGGDKTSARVLISALELIGEQALGDHCQ